MWYVLAAAIFWGTTGTAQALAPPGARPETVGALRLLVGGVALAVIALYQGNLRRDRPWPRRTVFLGMAGMAAYQLFFFAGVARTGVAAGTMVAIGSAPMWAGLMGWLFLGERPRHRWALATALAVSGSVALLLSGHEVTVGTAGSLQSTGAVTLDAGGILLALGAGAAYAETSLVIKALLATQPPAAVNAVIFCGGALLLAPLLATANLAWLVQPAGILVALHLGLVATAAAYVLYAHGLKRMPVASAVTVGLAEPLTATSLGLLFLGEEMTALTALGMVLIFAGLALLAK